MDKLMLQAALVNKHVCILLDKANLNMKKQHKKSIIMLKHTFLRLVRLASSNKDA